jgi:hypothetical protein
MAITKSQTTRWSANVKVEAQEQSIAASVANLAWQAEAVGAKTIKIIGVGTPTIATYVPGDGLTYEALTDNEVDLNLSVFKEFSFSVNELEQAQSTPDYVPAALTKAGRALALEADKDLFLNYTNASIPAGNKIGSVGSSVSIVEANVLRTVATMAQKLRENHVPRDEAWLVVPPWFMTKLQQAAQSVLQENTEVFEFGVVYKYAGLNIVESTELAAVGTDSDEYQIMAFSQRAIAHAATIQKIESLMNPEDFGELVRGLYAFGSEVVYPAEVVVLSAEEGAES